MIFSLNTSIESLYGVSEQKAKYLSLELKLGTLEDLIFFFPKKYIDRSRFYLISELSETGAYIQIIGKIIAIEEVNKRDKKYLRAKFIDRKGSALDLLWFKKASFIKEKLKKDIPLVIFGKITFFSREAQMIHPEIETLEAYQLKKRLDFYPIYPFLGEKAQKRGVTNKWMMQIIKEALIGLKGHLKENLSEAIRKRFNFLSREKSLEEIHFPTSLTFLQQARHRLKFEELFVLQWMLLSKKIENQKIQLSYPCNKIGDLFMRFYHDVIPFNLTEAQKKVIKEIREDLGQKTQMNRLLQGDVGSGKTMVAFLSMLIALDNGYQACLMAPTEVLASQHYLTIKKFADLLGIQTALLIGATKAKEKREIYERIKTKEIFLVVGTHALIQEKVNFDSLALVVIDEQHRFGVAQRASFWKKSPKPPHILLMSATPIARTLAMSIYGELDVSIMDELPKGRRPIKTFHFYENQRLSVLSFLRKQLSMGFQAYIVYPLIEDSKNKDYKYLMDGYNSMVRDFPSPTYHIGILHGKMKPQEKEIQMKDFLEKRTQIMVATTVIEVGVDVPNASLIIIENAERFGLLQLHQLRGRVGRGSQQSYCILLSGDAIGDISRQRLNILSRSHDGFEIAEWDLKLRGPGDLMGTQQSGLIKTNIADLVKDGAILQKAKKEVWDLLNKDFYLESKENKPIRQLLLDYKDKLLWGRVG